MPMRSSPSKRSEPREASVILIDFWRESSAIFGGVSRLDKPRAPAILNSYSGLEARHKSTKNPAAYLSRLHIDVARSSVAPDAPQDAFVRWAALQASSTDATNR